MRGERFRDTELKISIILTLTGFRTPQPNSLVIYVAAGRTVQSTVRK